MGVATDVGWDSGTGDPASTLGPIKGSWSLGVGAQFNPAPNYFIAAGVKYYWLGDAKRKMVHIIYRLMVSKSLQNRQSLKIIMR
jgi:opacity protein-like surface antigen